MKKKKKARGGTNPERARAGSRGTEFPVKTPPKIQVKKCNFGRLVIMERSRKQFPRQREFEFRR